MSTLPPCADHGNPIPETTEYVTRTSGHVDSSVPLEDAHHLHRASGRGCAHGIARCPEVVRLAIEVMAGSDHGAEVGVGHRAVQVRVAEHCRGDQNRVRRNGGATFFSPAAA